MRKLIEKTVFSNLKKGLFDIRIAIYDTPLGPYLKPLLYLKYEEGLAWLTEARLQDIEKMLMALSNEKLLKCLAEQYCEKFR